MTVPLVFVALDPLYAADLNDVSSSVVMRCTSGTRPGSPTEGMYIYETDTDRMRAYDGAAWYTISPVTALTAGSSTTTSATYANLGDAVTTSISVLTGTTALLAISAGMINASGSSMWTAVAVSGATTVAAADANGVRLGCATAALITTQTRVWRISSLTAGVNVFSLRYKVDGGTGTAELRSITYLGA